MSYNLFLDDVRNPEQCAEYMPVNVRYMYPAAKWEVVRSTEEFVRIIEKRGLPILVSFDHDLADVHYNPSTRKEGFTYHEKTGYDAAKWLVNYCIDKHQKLPTWLVHSQNPVGAENIRKLLENFQKHQDGESGDNKIQDQKNTGINDITN